MTARSSDPLTLTAATPADVPVLFDLVQALAAYEKLTHEVTGTAADLHRHLFGDRPYAEAILARLGSTPVGFALFFHNFSTFLMQPGIYLEDLFVLPDYRGVASAKRCWRTWGRWRWSGAVGGWNGRCWTGINPRSTFISAWVPR
jgi:GNAT superfamily N-acetyltransferase